jgi:hypothetical protein
MRLLAITFLAGTYSFRRWRRPPAGVSAVKSPAASSAGWRFGFASFST